MTDRGPDNPRAFYDIATFPAIAAVVAEWRSIRAEFEAVRAELIDYVETDLYDQGWKVFGLWNLPHREALQGTLERCPMTTALIERHIPKHGAVAFSVLLPNTRIRPHLGYQGDFLRCHIGLEVPDGDCGLRVNGEHRAWAEGQALIFDDRLEHEAWNDTAYPRAVLLFDFDPVALRGASD